MPNAKEQTGKCHYLPPPEEGDNIWKVEQVSTDLAVPTQDDSNNYDIRWSSGPVKMTGSIDTNTYDLRVGISVNGINIDNIHGNLEDSIGLKINLFTAKGETRLYLKNGNEVWTHLDIMIVFDGSFQGDYKILSL